MTFAAHLARWRAERGIADPDPQRGQRTPTPDGLVPYCDRVIATRRAPAMLALVVMGRLTPARIDGHRHLSDLLDELYDDADEAEEERIRRIHALMCNDLALAQIRQRRRTRAA